MLVWTLVGNEGLKRGLQIAQDSLAPGLQHCSSAVSKVSQPYGMLGSSAAFSGNSSSYHLARKSVRILQGPVQQPLFTGAPAFY